jgi:hypothetical protein
MAWSAQEFATVSLGDERLNNLAALGLSWAM